MEWWWTERGGDSRGSGGRGERQQLLTLQQLVQQNHMLSPVGPKLEINSKDLLVFADFDESESPSESKNSKCK